MQVEHGRQVQPALIAVAMAATSVTHARLLQDTELVREDVGRDRATLLGVRRPLEATLAAASEAVFSHQTLDALLADSNATCLELAVGASDLLGSRVRLSAPSSMGKKGGAHTLREARVEHGFGALVCSGIYQ